MVCVNYWICMRPRRHEPSIVSSFIIQKVGAGVHYESVSHWNAQTDGAITTKYENDSMICLCSVFGIAI